MKKITLAAALSMTLLTQSALGAPLGADAVFSSENDMLTVSGTGKSGSEVTVVVLPFDSDPAALTSGTAGRGGAVFNMAHTDKDGRFSLSMGLMDNWDGGMYKAIVYQGDESAEIWFSYADADKAEEYIDDINSATSSGIADILRTNASDLGADADLAKKYADILGDYLYANKPKGGYSADSLLSEYTAGLALAMVKEGDMSLGDALGRFSKYIGVDMTADYNVYNSKIRKELERLIKLDTLEDGNAEEIYRKNLLLARINKADSDTELRSIIEENATELGISLGDYSKLSNDYKKNQVFAEMLGKAYKDFDEVDIAFDDAVDDVADGGSSGSGGSSSGGGSAISGGSFGGGTVTNTPAKEESGAVTFTDMNGHWAQAKVNNLAALGIVNGYNDGSFLPEKKVTRAEFSKMLCLTLGLGGDSYRADFADVAPADWYAPYVLALSGKGIVTGYNGSFNPNDEITRQDAAVMTWRALQQNGVAKGSGATFADDASVADYAKEAVSVLGGLGVINGYNNNFNPNNNTTRAETASILNNVLAIIR